MIERKENALIPECGDLLIVAEQAFHEFYRSFAGKNLVVQLCTPKAALEILMHQTADLILVDCGFDIAGGLNLVRDIKAAQPSTPVILITERTINVAKEAFQAGARAFLEKPVTLDDLSGTIENLLSLKKASREKRAPFIAPAAQVIPRPASTLTTDKPAPIVRVINYIENNLSEKISLETLAAQANVSKYHFCRLFAHHMGMTPLQFAIFFRIEKSKELIRRGDQTVSEIAVQVGFNDLGTFLRQFRKITGVTPTDYRKSVNPVRKPRR